MSDNYILRYNKESGFNLESTSDEREVPFVSIEFVFDDNPKEEHLAQLKDIFDRIDPKDRTGLFLNFDKVYTKDNATPEDKVELDDTSRPYLDTQSVKKFVNAFMAAVPKNYTAVHVEELDEDNIQVLCPIVQNLPKQIVNLNLTNCLLAALEQDLDIFNQALKATNLKRLSLCGALNEYEEDHVEALHEALPDTLTEINLFENDLEPEPSEQLADLVDESINVVWRKEQRTKTEFPDIHVSDIAKGIWGVLTYAASAVQRQYNEYTSTKPTTETLAPVATVELSSSDVESKDEFKAPTQLDLSDSSLVSSDEDVTQENGVGTKPVTSLLTEALTNPGTDPLSLYALAVSEDRKDLPLVDSNSTSQISDIDEEETPASQQPVRLVDSTQQERRESPTPNPLTTVVPEEVVNPESKNQSSNTVSSSLLFGFFQAVKNVGIILAAVVIGAIVGVGVGFAVSAFATPAVGVGVGVAAGAVVTAAALPTMYRFFSSNNDKKDGPDSVSLLEESPIFP